MYKLYSYIKGATHAVALFRSIYMFVFLCTKIRSNIFSAYYWSLHVRQARHEFGKSHCRDAKNTIHSFVFNCLVRQYIDGYIIKGNSFYSRLLQYKVSLCLPFWFSLVLVLSLSSVVLPTKLQYHLHPRNYHHLPTITMRKGVWTNKPRWAFAK